MEGDLTLLRQETTAALEQAHIEKEHAVEALEQQNTLRMASIQEEQLNEVAGLRQVIAQLEEQQRELVESMTHQ